VGQVHLAALGQFRTARDTVRGVIEANAIAYGIGEDGAQQPYGARGDTSTTTDYRHAMWLGLLSDRRDTGSDIVHEGFDVVARDRRH
jgi:hypothetical protein